MDAAAELDAWLQEHVAEPRRTLARGAASNLSDFATCEAEDLEDCLQISTWPPLARSRFLRAWRKLKGDEAPAPATAVATVATQTDIVGPVQPVAAAAGPTGSSSAAAAADDDDFEASSDDDSDGGARNGPKRRRGGATSRFVGVSKQRNKWAVRYADRQGNRHTVGTYDDEETAALKFNEAIIATIFSSFIVAIIAAHYETLMSTIIAAIFIAVVAAHNEAFMSTNITTIFSTDTIAINVIC